MEELFQLIVALFIVSFPILNLFARRRQARRVRKRREKEAAAEAAGGEAPARPDRGRSRRRAAGRTDVATREGEPRGRFARWAQRLEERTRSAAGEHGQSGEPGGEAAVGGRQRPPESSHEGRMPHRDDSSRRSENDGDTPTLVAAGRAPQTGRAAMERIGELPPLQQAVVWAEVLGRPKALRRTSDPWDDDVSS
jgi:hypothetical protein